MVPPGCELEECTLRRWDSCYFFVTAGPGSLYNHLHAADLRGIAPRPGLPRDSAGGEDRSDHRPLVPAVCLAQRLPEAQPRSPVQRGPEPRLRRISGAGTRGLRGDSEHARAAGGRRLGAAAPNHARDSVHGRTSRGTEALGRGADGEAPRRRADVHVRSRRGFRRERAAGREKASRLRSVRRHTHWRPECTERRLPRHCPRSVVRPVGVRAAAAPIRRQLSVETHCRIRHEVVRGARHERSSRRRGVEAGTSGRPLLRGTMGGGARRRGGGGPAHHSRGCRPHERTCRHARSATARELPEQRLHRIRGVRGARGAGDPEGERAAQPRRRGERLDSSRAGQLAGAHDTARGSRHHRPERHASPSP